MLVSTPLPKALGGLVDNDIIGCCLYACRGDWVRIAGLIGNNITPAFPRRIRPYREAICVDSISKGFFAGVEFVLQHIVG